MNSELVNMDSRILQTVLPAKQTGRYLIYWMQQAQRVQFNPAFDLAVKRSNETGLPLVVLFVVSIVPDANLRHYHFMLQGLWEVAAALQGKGIEFYMLAGEPSKVLVPCIAQALEVIGDSGYLHFQKEWRQAIRQCCIELGCGWTEVETEPLVPIAVASEKEEYAAATLRPKLLKALLSFGETNSELFYLPKPPSRIQLSNPNIFPGEHVFATLENWMLEQVDLASGIEACPEYPGGRQAAWQRLQTFLSEKLPFYASKRNEPSLDIQSGLSSYLHFGQISTAEIIQQLLGKVGIEKAELCSLIRKKPLEDGPLAGAVAFAEELVIRRELSFNFCRYNPSYDSFSCLPDWSRRNLINHLGDQREQHYSLDRLEQCATDDKYWNAAQQEMMEKGKMHNYMRMYWGKRLLAWFKSPEDVYQILIYLNNRYELDGRDPNAFAGIAWCFGKHDRPWQRRPIYGSVRYMNAAGLERKFNMVAYLNKINGKGG